MNSYKLRVGDRVKCKYEQGSFYAGIENINYPYFDVDIYRYAGYPMVAVTAKCRIHKKDIVNKTKEKQ